MLLTFIHIYLNDFKMANSLAILLCIGLLLCCAVCFAQVGTTGKKDSVLLSLSVPLVNDSIPSSFNLKKDTSVWNGFRSSLQKDKDLNKYNPGFKINPVSKSPFLKFNGGSVGYNYSYRSTVDTPFIYNNLSQHQFTANLGITVANNIPLRVNAYIRRSNSPFFQNITDVQVAFDARAYRDNLGAKLRNQLESQGAGIKDTLAQKLSAIKQIESLHLRNWINNPLTIQKLADAHDIINIPQKAYKPGASDSSNTKNADSLRKLAQLFLDLYAKTIGKYKAVTAQADSLKKLYDNSVLKYKQYQQLAQGQVPQGSSYNQWKNKLEQYSSKPVNISGMDHWLLGVRSFGLGRNTLNYSELTVKNISVTGMNMEYNSWYYFAVAAGLVDYRFRDFISGPQGNTKQYLYLARIGLGRLERNYFILTAYHGQKQLFAATTTGNQLGSIQVTGYSAEAKWQINANTFALAEAAQSFSPDFQSTPPGRKPGWSFSDNTNKALSVKIYSFFPKTATRLEGQYKFMGANFESFSSFQTNAEVRSWYIKADQGFFNRKLRLVASLKTNDFSNPYVLQHYSSSTVFKSISATFKSKGLPVLSVGYMPMSQITVLGNQPVEDQFQTLTASLSHFYKIAHQQVATSIIYSRFFNSNTDTAFLFYNSNNIYLSHSLFFKHFSGNITISLTRNHNYAYNVMDENFNIPVSSRASVGMGVKIHSLVGQENKLGEFVNANIKFSKKDIIYFSVENGYLPGNANRLVRNAMGNISYNRSIK